MTFLLPIYTIYAKLGIVKGLIAGVDEQGEASVRENTKLPDEKINKDF